MRELVVLSEGSLGGEHGQRGTGALGVAATLLLAGAAEPSSAEVAAVHDGAQLVLDAGEAVDLGEGVTARFGQVAPGTGAATAYTGCPSSLLLSTIEQGSSRPILLRPN